MNTIHMRISSDNYVSNKDSEGSLHDSMEILEDVTTIDHFDPDPKNYIEGTLSNNSQNVKLTRVLESSSNSLLSSNLDISESSARYNVKEGSEELMF